MIQTQVDNEANYTKRPLPRRLAYWWRVAFDKRSRQAVAKSTIDTFLDSKSLSTAEQTDILSNIEAD